MTNDKTHRQPTDGLGDYGRTYFEAVQIIAAALREFSNVVCTPADYRHNAKAILARLAHSDILVEKVNYQPDADNVDNIHADHQAALLRAASHHAKTTQPVPGWPVVIYTQTGDDSALGIVNRTTALNMPADIARPATAESITQPPADKGEDVVKKLTDEDAKLRLYCKFQLVGGEWIGPAKLIHVACEDSAAPLYYNDYGDFFYGCRECTSEELAQNGLTQPPRPTRNMFTKPIS